MLDYVISDIKPKVGPLRSVHEDILNCECYILDLQKGYRGIIKVRLGDEYHFETHTFRTSSVLDFYFSKDSKILTIETANTVYTLDALKPAPYPFSEELVRE